MKTTTANKLRLNNKIYLVGLFLAISIATEAQDDFNNTKNWGVSVNYNIHSTPSIFASISSHLFFKHKKSCFFAGYGLRSSDINTQLEPEYWLGYRRFPFKNKNRLKFFFQTFLYYSSSKHVPSPYIPHVFYTLNLGIGLRYDISKKFAATISSNMGRGFSSNEYEVRGSLTIFPAIVSIAYSFNNIKQK